MPKLSPSQCDFPGGTKLLKWHVQENELLDLYALVCEVETTALTDDKTNDVFQLPVEIQEECYIATLLYKEGDFIKAGLPIAICCDEEEELESVKATSKSDFQMDAYEQSEYTLAGFQAYTKSILKASWGVQLIE